MVEIQDTRGDHVWACLMIADEDAQDMGLSTEERMSTLGLVASCDSNTCSKCGVEQLCFSDGIYKRGPRWASFKYHASKVV